MKIRLLAGRMARCLSIVLVALGIGALLSPSAFAQSSSGPIIFDVRRSLPLEPNEPVTKDFYINAGAESGFKKGVYISVVRALPVHDPIQNKQQAIITIPVGSLQIIHVEPGITVARLQTEMGDNERPTLEFEGIMIGDRVDLRSITTKAPEKKSARKGWFSEANPESAPTQEKIVTIEVGTQTAGAQSLPGTATSTDASVVPAMAPQTNPDPASAPQAPREPATSQPPASADFHENAFPAQRTPGSVRIAADFHVY